MPSNDPTSPIEPASRGHAWRPAAVADLRLEPDEILVLRVALDLPAGDVAARRGLLTPAEAAQADRFHREIDRARYVVRRACLREVLAILLGVRPTEVTLAVGARGKPALASPQSALCFNLSHSAGWVLLAFTLGADLGVDIEGARRVPDALALAQRFFTRAEAAYLAECPAAEVERAFFSLWTRKEAVVKCVGEGLGLGLDTFELTREAVAAGERVRLETSPTGEVWVHPVPRPTSESTAALACTAPRRRMRCLGYERQGA